MQHEIRIENLEDLPSAADALLSYCKNDKYFAFYGEMGAGKTTLITAICKKLSVPDAISSPTFSLINEYRGSVPVYHMDLFRLKDIDEALEIGIEDYFEMEGIFFIEWPEVIAELLPDQTVHVRMRALNEQARTVTIERR